MYEGVVQYDFRKTTLNKFERTSFLNTSPTILLNLVAKLRANCIREKSKLLKYFSKLNDLSTFAREKAGSDILYKANYNYKTEATYKQYSRA